MIKHMMKDNNPVRITVIAIGSLSVIAGIVLAFTQSEFNEWFSEIVLGLSMIGGALFHDFREPLEDELNLDN